MPLINFKEKIDLSDYTLVIPSVSVGNVPQLTIDLLVTTLKFENAATVWHPGLVASVGSDPFYFESKTICTACELYVNKEKKLAALQLRSTIETKLMLKFFVDLIDSLNALKLNRIVILATGFDYELHNISEKDTFYFGTNMDNEHIAKITFAKPLERNSNGKFFVSGSGFATKLYEALSEIIPCTMIVKYISEGENIFDAQIYLKKLLQFMGKDADVKTLSYPSSWSYVYGAPPPRGLF